MKKLLLYAANGVFNTAVTYALYLLLIRAIDYRIAIILVYAVGICLSYLVNGIVVFQTRGRFEFFVLVYIGLLLLNLLITWLLVERFAWSEAFAPLPAVVLVFVLGFAINKYIVFQKGSTASGQGH